MTTNFKLKTNIFPVDAVQDMPFIKRGQRCYTFMVEDTSKLVDNELTIVAVYDTNCMKVVFFKSTKNLQWLFEYVTDANYNHHGLLQYFVGGKTDVVSAFSNKPVKIIL